MKLQSPKDIHLLMNSAIPAAALGTAIETGLLWQLEANPLSASQVAQALGIPGKRCHYWLQVLTMLGILENGPTGYAPSTLARKAILDIRSQASWQFLAREERESSSGVTNLPLYISEPGSIWAAQGVAEPRYYVDKMKTDPTEAMEFTRLLYEVHQQLANQIAELLDLRGVQRMMDLGGGSGVVSMALLRKYPALTSTVVDIENVCIAGRQIAAEEGLSERISYHPAEFANDDFPIGYDLVLKCDVGVFGLALYQKIYTSLKPGGRLVFAEHFSLTEDSAPVSRLDWTFRDSLRDPNFSYPTLDQVTVQLAQAGFDVSTEHLTLESGRIIVQAYK